MGDNDYSKRSNKPTRGSLVTVCNERAKKIHEDSNQSAHSDSHRTRHFVDNLQKVWIHE